ncbi:hypothetical protein AGMMS49940_17210 [Spirochaetia bacterium]|nr:hypothetical protein AGMMS49940_17210 [Spirochaetia bacterium]
MVKITEIAYNGWQHCLEMSNDTVKLIVTTDVGPRIIYFGAVNGENMFHQRKGQQGLVNSKEWHIYGGHRLWHSPQDGFRPNQVDNAPVSYKVSGNSVEMDCPEEEATRIRKQLCITMAADEPRVTVGHRIYNCGLWPINLGTWAMSVMREDGKVILPIPRKQTPDYYPNFSIVYWPWTKPNDSRFSIGEKYMTLQQDQNNKQWFKIGFNNTEGWGAYLLNGYMFVKTALPRAGEEYPDFGSTFEIYTDNEMTELESMGPLRTIARNEYTEHTEEWYLFRDIKMPKTEKEIEEYVSKPILKVIHT